MPSNPMTPGRTFFSSTSRQVIAGNDFEKQVTPKTFKAYSHATQQTPLSVVMTTFASLLGTYCLRQQFASDALSYEKLLALYLLSLVPSGLVASHHNKQQKVVRRALYDEVRTLIQTIEEQVEHAPNKSVVMNNLSNILNSVVKEKHKETVDPTATLLFKRERLQALEESIHCTAIPIESMKSK